MNAELRYLFLSAILLAVLWIPFVIGQVRTKGILTAEEYRTLRDPDHFPDWVRRANRAHLNMVEQFGAFAGLVVVAQFAQVSTPVTAWCAAIFFWARLAHAVAFLSGTGFLKIRMVIFVVGWLALMVFAWQIYAVAG